MSQEGSVETLHEFLVSKNARGSCVRIPDVVRLVHTDSHLHNKALHGFRLWVHLSPTTPAKAGWRLLAGSYGEQGLEAAGGPTLRRFFYPLISILALFIVVRSADLIVRVFGIAGLRRRIAGLRHRQYQRDNPETPRCLEQQKSSVLA